LVEKLLDTKLGLFELDSANKVKIKTDATSATHLRYFKFVGRLHSWAIIHGILVDPKFVGIFYPMVVLRMDKTRGADLIDSAVKDHMAQMWVLALIIDGPVLMESLNWTVKGRNLFQKQTLLCWILERESCFRLISS